MSPCTNCQTVNPPAAKCCQGCGQCLVSNALQAPTIGAAVATQVLLNSKTQVLPARSLTTFTQMNRTRLTQTVRTRREQVVFVVDVSGSMDGHYDNHYTKIQSAIRACMSMVIEKKRIDPFDEIALVVFNEKAIVLLTLMPVGANRAKIFQALEMLRADGGTDIDDGLKAAGKLYDWSQTDVLRKIILLTDGHGGNPLGTATDLKSRGTIIHVIGVGDSPANVDERLLKQVATTVNNELQYWFIKDHQALVAGVTSLANKTIVST